MLIFDTSDSSSVADRGVSGEVSRTVEREQVISLFERYGAAAPQERRLIRESVVLQYLPLAVSAARRYAPPAELEDLVQVACCGLLEAFDRFDPTRSAFPSFAWVTMTGLVRRHLRDHGWGVRPPRGTQEAANLLRRAWPELVQELGRTPEARDFAARLGLTLEEVHAARRASAAFSTVSTATFFDDNWCPDDSSDWQLVEIRALLGPALQKLSAAERDLLRLRFVDDMSQAQIAVLTGISQMEVSRRLSKLMAKLRASVGEADEW